MAYTLTDPISVLSGVGDTRATQLHELGIETINDLLLYAPFRYETVQQQVKIADLQEDTIACFRAQVVSKIPIRSARFKSMLKVRVMDETGSIELTWFNASFLLNSLKVGTNFFFTGKVTAYKGKRSLINPTVEREAPVFGSLVPVYHESSSITSRFLRRLLAEALQKTTLSEDSKIQKAASKYDYLDLKTSFSILHHPESEDLLKKARESLAFREMYTLIAQVRKEKMLHQQSQTVGKLQTTNTSIETFASFLPYPLTVSQKQAITAIALDLVQKHPMYRLLQGEVGSGKTTVAAFALWVAALQKPPAVLLCPTKILAMQHYETLVRLFKNSALRIGLVTGKEKMTDCDILVGTHALFSSPSLRPSMVVIDEEHRFGVQQRAHFFTSKKKPHFLSMTATPIPRTVALTALADRDISFIAPHKAHNLTKTWVIEKEKRQKAYEWIKKTLKQTGGQAFIICPFIDESENETLANVKSAKREFKTLANIFPECSLQLLHGKLKDEEKDTIFSAMMGGKIDILVTTPVVEVGVDIPKASIIVIEGAERFGLAQLHQLRGRVGRRGQEAYCLLFTSDGIQQTKRLHYFATTYDGNELAEYDLKHRGSGELLGVRQHGFDTLTFASWFDTELLSRCKTELDQTDPIL